MASAPIRPSGVSPRAARTGAATAKASCGSVSRCQPNAAPFVVATLRASSLAASGVAPTMSTSSPADRPSSQARARRIRRSFAAETMAFALIWRASRRLVGTVVRLPCYSLRHSRVADRVAAHVPKQPGLHMAWFDSISLQSRHLHHESGGRPIAHSGGGHSMRSDRAARALSATPA